MQLLFLERHNFQEYDVHIWAIHQWLILSLPFQAHFWWLVQQLVWTRSSIAGTPTLTTTWDPRVVWCSMDTTVYGFLQRWGGVVCGCLIWRGTSGQQWSVIGNHWYLYSWDGPGHPWQAPQPCPDHMGSQDSLVFDGHHSLWALAELEMRRSGVWMFDMASDQWSTVKCHR